MAYTPGKTSEEFVTQLIEQAILLARQEIHPPYHYFREILQSTSRNSAITQKLWANLVRVASDGSIPSKISAIIMECYYEQNGDPESE